MDYKFADIRENYPGMLTEAEGEFLAEMCKDKVVLELGSYTGMSTIAIALVAKHVVSCDWHRGDAHVGGRDTLAKLDANLRKYGVREKVTMLVGRFEVALPMLADGIFDVAYIDGAHDYESVRMDSYEAHRLLQRNGIMIWHDRDLPCVSKYLGGRAALGPDRMAWERSCVEWKR